MQLTFGYQVHPGRCHICASAETRPTIDTSADDLGHMRRYRVYICDQCVAAMYAMLEPTKVLVEKQWIADKEGEVTALSNEIARLMAEASALDIRLAKAVSAQ